jgi:hypothetical protein
LDISSTVESEVSVLPNNSGIEQNTETVGYKNLFVLDSD